MIILNYDDWRGPVGPVFFFATKLIKENVPNNQFNKLLIITPHKTYFLLHQIAQIDMLHTNDDLKKILNVPLMSNYFLFLYKCARSLRNFTFVYLIH